MFTLTSSAFEDGGTVPSRHTCEGVDVAPPIAFSDVPDGATHLALIMEDPDAPTGTWTHWMFWNLPADAADLPDGDAKGRGATEGENSWGGVGYGGPCPPEGTHHYVFRAFATAGRVEIPAAASPLDILDSLEEHAIAQAKLTGTYRRVSEAVPRTGAS